MIKTENSKRIATAVLLAGVTVAAILLLESLLFCDCDRFNRGRRRVGVVSPRSGNCCTGLEYCLHFFDRHWSSSAVDLSTCPAVGCLVLPCSGG